MTAIHVFVQPLQAQVTIDVSKITCEQFILFKIMDPEKIAYWLSGYYNAKRDNTVIDPQVFTEIFDRMKDYCRSNLKLTVMQAVEKLPETTKR
jgi:hypothetical protein